ncbi:Hypothetical predicted protein [Octopus vulgaris]|uniref:Uncharacterized protein n=1 Tax=Octopus vulgaris TaxID=6645 RepID=A0AA36BR53_OCTVU|nr:Hypothetical predicted protein [Octopus vulgaris]
MLAERLSYVANALQRQNDHFSASSHIYLEEDVLIMGDGLHTHTLMPTLAWLCSRTKCQRSNLYKMAFSKKEEK